MVALRQEHSSVLGDITLDSKGDIVNPVYVWYKFMDGKYRRGSVDPVTPAFHG